MRRDDDPLTTPVYLKTRREAVWPRDRVFYTLASNGLFLCRDNEFFQSCVPAREFPRELSEQGSFFRSRYPPVARAILEYVVGFFAQAGLQGAEAIVLLAWDRLYRRVRVVVPRQVATVGRAHGDGGGHYPIGVTYEIPADLPQHLTIIGDIHSHVDVSAWASFTDCDDESFRAGLHVIIGRLRREPPEVFVEAVVDGRRFELPWTQVFAGYGRRRVRFPRSWRAKVEVKVRGRPVSASYVHAGNGNGNGNGDVAATPLPSSAPTNLDDRRRPADDDASNQGPGGPPEETDPDAHPRSPRP
jgi:hypothetical protein